MKAIEVRDDWVETTLGEVSAVIGGGTPSTSVPEYWEGEIVWLTPTEITSHDGEYVSNSIRKISESGLKNSGAQMLPKGSVILTSRASVGFVAISTIELCTNQGFQSLVPNDSVLAEFLMFWIQQNRSEFESRSAGSTFKEISKSNVKSIKLSLPPLPEQKRIADLISSTDSYIEALQQQLESARKSRNGVLHELLNTGGDDWIASSLGIQMSLEYGKPLTESNRDGVGFPVYGSAGIVGMHSKPLVTTAPVIVVGRKGTAGAVYWSEDQCFIIDTAYFVEAKTDIELKFLFHLLNFLDLKSVTAQTGVPGLNRDRAYSLKCKIPPKAKQNEIVEIMTTMDKMTNQCETAIAEAQNLRSGLLSGLLSGEHKIPASYDKIMGAAL
jgi:type I restriction enzyme S subunit